MPYKLSTIFGIVQRIEDGAFIPSDINNSDYKLFLVWQAAGNVPTPADAVTVIDFSDVAVTSDKLLKAAAIYLGSLSGKTPAQVAAGIKAVYAQLP